MIALFGYGTTTKAIAKKFRKCQIFDDHFSEKSHDEFGNLLLPVSEFEKLENEMQIPSPSFPPSHDLVKKAKNLVSEYDFFEKNMPYCIWISGTNGKTTTTQMCDFLLKDKGSLCGGNIGTPLAELDKNASLWILETSSYMSFYTKKATPGIYLLLPITPDHLKWHGSFENYEEAKLSPLLRMGEGSVAIIPSKYKNFPSKSKIIFYDDEYDLAKKLEIDITKINIKAPFLLDAILAMSVPKIIFDEITYDKINEFKTDFHKLEEVYDVMQRVWVNDSKGTNVDATIEALKKYKDKQIFLILGGDDKGVDLKGLFEVIRPLHVKIFAIGENTQKLVNLANGIGTEVEASYELKTAVSFIATEHTKSSVAILSPAAASFDQFDSYIQRGNIFKNLISLL